MNLRELKRGVARFVMHRSLQESEMKLGARRILNWNL